MSKTFVVKHTRRAVIVGAALYVIDKIAGGALEEIGKQGMTFAGNHLASNDKTGDDLRFSRAFTRAFNSFRTFRELERNVPTSISVEEDRLMKLFGIFIGAKGPPTYLNSEHEKELKGYLSRSSDPSTRLVLADVLAAQYVRLGLAGEAKSLFEGLNLDDYVDDDETVTLTNQLLSISYTSLTRGDALNPYEWGFERATSRLDRARLADFGFQFDSRGYLTDIASPDLVAERISRPMDNALGFYIANWFSLQMVARSEGPSVVDSAEIHMELLRSFVRKGALPRQVWNFCFIAGLQLHRKGLAVENANNEFQLRNKFFEVCVDASLGLPRDQIKRLEDLESDDPVPICMAILLRSEPSLSSLVQQAKIGSVEQLSQLSRSIRPPLVVRRAADQFRLLRGEESVTPQIWDLYAADDNTLGIYLTPIPEIKNSLLAR